MDCQFLFFTILLSLATIFVDSSKLMWKELLKTDSNGGLDQWMCPTDREEYKFYETSNYTKCFAFLKDSRVTWSEAHKYCQNSTLSKTGEILPGTNDKGELVSVPDIATNNFLESALVTYGIKQIFWTGGTKNCKDVWMWGGSCDSMKPVNYSNWDPHDEDIRLVDTSKTPVVSLKRDKIGFGVDGQWRTLPSSYNKPFICQWTFQTTHRRVDCGGGRVVRGCQNCGHGQDRCSYECYWMHKAGICVDIKEANLPESYFISSDGLTSRTYPDILGEYLLLTTQYKGTEMLLYKKTSQLTGNTYYLYNRTSSQKNGEWIVKHDGNTLLRTIGNLSSIQAPSKGWNVVLWKEAYDVPDSSLLVRVDRDCFLSEWITGDCSKECGGGYRTNTRQILKPAVQDGECSGELQRTEHCAEQHCPGVQALIVLVTLAMIGAMGGGLVYYLSYKGIISIKYDMDPPSLIK